jgi:subtilisin family serine protease
MGGGNAITMLSINIAYGNTSLGGFNMDPVRVAEGIEWAAAQHCRITNSSWGSNSESFLEPVLEAFANTRISNQMVHFAASGNDGTSSISSPSSAYGVISVGATASDKIKASYSQYGTGLDLVAPGSSIITTDRVGSLGYSTTDYTTNNGTSYATPIAAACAALVLSKNPALTADEVENVLKTTATDLGTSGYDTSYGYGLVKASAALAAVDPYVFFGATNSTGGWKQHAVFGWLCDEAFPWYWHAQHGWQYTSSTSADNFIFYDMTANDWFYTTIGENATYPYLYRYGDNTWYYYYTGTSGPRVFCNMTTGQYVNF